MMVRQLFDETDLDGSGALDRDEIRGLAATMGVKLDQRDLAAAMNEMDESGGGETHLLSMSSLRT